ncbi:MAG: YvrJ family protein [Ezakiella sp.]|nr:YvrJ family protein [Ezakiella sp.]
MQEFFEIIGNQAFPIAISVYLLTRVNTELASLKDAINKLTATIERKQ